MVLQEISSSTDLSQEPKPKKAFLTVFVAQLDKE